MVLFQFLYAFKNQCEKQMSYLIKYNYAANNQFCVVYENNIDEVALFQLHIVPLVISLRPSGDHGKFELNKT